MLTKQEALLGRSTWVKNSRIREPRRTSLPFGLQSWVLWWRNSHTGCLWPVTVTQGPSWWHMHRTVKIDSSEKDAERTYGLASPVSFWPLPNSSCWWWLVSSVFLTRKSYCKIALASGYHGACLGWVVSVSVSPNTSKELMTKDTHRNSSVQHKGTEPFSPNIFEESLWALEIAF